MQIAIRPFLLAGIAFSGAAAVALTPITPNLPDIQMPAISTPAMELAALPSYLEWVQEGTEAETKNIPWHQILDPDFNGALSSAAELGGLLFRQFLPAATILDGGETASTAIPQQTALEFINSVEQILDNTIFLPTIMNDLVQVVQAVATSTVEPVLDLVFRITVSTLYRATNITRAVFRDVPEIAMTALAAGGGILTSLSDGMNAVIMAAMTDPLTIVGVLTDSIMQVGAVALDHALKVIDAFDKFRHDLESALLTPPPTSTPAPAGAVAPAAIEPPAVGERLAPATLMPSTDSDTSPTPEIPAPAADSVTDSSTASAKLDDASETLAGADSPAASETPAADTGRSGSGLGRSARPHGKQPSADESSESSPAGKTGTKAGSKPRSTDR